MQRQTTFESQIVGTDFKASAFSQSHLAGYKTEDLKLGRAVFISVKTVFQARSLPCEGGKKSPLNSRVANCSISLRLKPFWIINPPSPTEAEVMEYSALICQTHTGSPTINLHFRQQKGPHVLLPACLKRGLFVPYARCWGDIRLTSAGF